MRGLMELRQLEYFVAVAGERSFTRAAQRLHVVQSAVSAAITALEKDLHVVLLERNARRVQLTEAGEALLPEAQAVLDAALAARNAVEGLSRGLRGTLRVGMLADLGIMDLPGLARDFRNRYPGVELQLRDAPAGSAGCSALCPATTSTWRSPAPPPPAPRVQRPRAATRPAAARGPTGHHSPGGTRSGSASWSTRPSSTCRPASPCAPSPTRFSLPTGCAALSLRRSAASTPSRRSFRRRRHRHPARLRHPPHANLRAVKVREHDFRWSLNAVVLRRRRPTAAAAALLQLAGAHLIEQPGVERPS